MTQNHQSLVVDVYSIKARGIWKHSVHHSTKAAVEISTLVPSRNSFTLIVVMFHTDNFPDGTS